MIKRGKYTTMGGDEARVDLPIREWGTIGWVKGIGIVSFQPDGTCEVPDGTQMGLDLNPATWQELPADQHRYFLLNGKILYLPPCVNNSGNCWVHRESGIEREHLKPNGTDGLQEVTETEARRYDAEMFAECLDRPYGDSDTLMQFYEYTYKRDGGTL
jgi:hypothetical protein